VLGRFFPLHSWLVVRDGRRLQSPPDEEDVEVERSYCDAHFFSSFFEGEGARKMTRRDLVPRFETLVSFFLVTRVHSFVGEVDIEFFG
jgi:hypothetical protein